MTATQMLQRYLCREEGNPKIWVDLRMGTPKKETMIRCNVHTPQEAIEAVATEEWEMDVGTQRHYQRCWQVKR
jgi:hypothetical protein